MRRRPLLIALVVAAVVAAGVLWVRRNGQDTVEVNVQAAARQPVFRSVVTASGEIVASRYAEVGSSIMGRIVSLPVSEGDRVAEGQVVARIDPVQARAEVEAAQALVDAQRTDALAAERQVNAAEADLALAEARLKEADLTLDRTRELAAQGLAPRADLDSAQAAADTARAQVAASQAALERARNVATAARQRIAQVRAQATRVRDLLAKTEITAPIAGVVSRLQVREGEMVVIGIQNQPGTTLMTISDLSTINAEVKVAEADVLRLEVGQAATVDLEAIPSRRFQGRVVEIGTSALASAGVTAAAREFRVVIRLDEADTALRPGLTCDAEVLVTERTSVLTVPLQAVVLRGPAAGGSPGGARGAAAAAAVAGGGPGDGQRTGVFLVEDGHARFTPVTTGIIGGLQIEVAGISEGAPVIVGPFQALRDLEDGTRIQQK